MRTSLIARIALLIEIASALNHTNRNLCNDYYYIVYKLQKVNRMGRCTMCVQQSTHKPRFPFNMHQMNEWMNEYERIGKRI